MYVSTYENSISNTTGLSLTAKIANTSSRINVVSSRAKLSYVVEPTKARSGSKSRSNENSTRYVYGISSVKSRENAFPLCF